MADLHDSWRRAWQTVGVRVGVRAGARGDGQALRDSLVARYEEIHRAYHTLQHLRECLGWFDRLRGLAEHPAEVELALWFHDAIYDPQRHDNEERSAELARESLEAADVDRAVAARVAALVLATRHSAVPAGRDEQVLVDIDLAILGAEPRRFAEYDRQIRQEYSFVPAETYRLKRREVLQSFLERPRLYATEPMQAALEEPARRNLRRVVHEVFAADRANRSMPSATVIPVLPCRDVAEAAAWLVRAFGFAERLRIGGHRIQLAVGEGAVVLAEGDPGDGARVMVRVRDVDAHHARAVEQGADVSGEPVSHPYGERQYSARDPSGHVWTFSQSVADMDPAAWGGELVGPP
jgi:predicted metal-dependent HD superfamily phosphohydrolase/uncharacterized glyoxalase superfamily protein PhnB